MTTRHTELTPALVSALLAAQALLLEHLGLWGWHTLWEKPHGRLKGYTLGTATLWAAFTCWAALTGDWRAWRANTAILAAGGATILTAWLVRDERAHRADFGNEAHAQQLIDRIRRDRTVGWFSGQDPEDLQA